MSLIGKPYTDALNGLLDKPASYRPCRLSQQRLGLSASAFVGLDERDMT